MAELLDVLDDIAVRNVGELDDEQAPHSLDHLGLEGGQVAGLGGRQVGVVIHLGELGDGAGDKGAEVDQFQPVALHAEEVGLVNGNVVADLPR